MDNVIENIIENGKPLLIFKRPYGNGRDFIYIQSYDSYYKTYMNKYPINHNTEYNNLIAEDEVLVKWWGENEAIIPKLLESGFFEDTGKTMNMGHTSALIWKIVKDIPYEEK